MTTEVKVIHNGGNHSVIVEVNGNRAAALKVKGDEFSAYVHQGQSLKVREAQDAEEKGLLEN